MESSLSSRLKELQRLHPIGIPVRVKVLHPKALDYSVRVAGWSVIEDHTIYIQDWVLCDLIETERTLIHEYAHFVHEDRWQKGLVLTQMGRHDKVFHDILKEMRPDDWRQHLGLKITPQMRLAQRRAKR